MAKFITGKDLEEIIYNIIWDAEDTLLIVSPFIKLDDYFKRLFNKHLENPKVHVIIVFGKNTGAVSRSMSKVDFDYFKKFPNISVIYVPELHAKYYGNELQGVITSINLHDYSFKNNIEFGVLSERSVLNLMNSNSDNLAWETCFGIAETNEAVYISRPVYEKRVMSTLLGKKYVKSSVLHDITDRFYSGATAMTNPANKKTLSSFPEALDFNRDSSSRPAREDFDTIPKKPSSKHNSKQGGYCIRTGVPIPFNVEKPLSYPAFKKWNEFGDADFPEHFCHFSGEPSNGNTSVKKPILRKNWKTAKDAFDL